MEAENDIERLESGSFRILPLVYRNLSAHGVKDRLMGKLKGVYRFTWYKNRTLWKRIALILHAFSDAGIETLVLKGAPLAELYYRDWGQRPMGDVDVLVRRDEVSRAVKVLGELGWRTSDVSLELKLQTRHSTLFRDAGNSRLDLHWHVLGQLCDESVSTEFWLRAVRTDVGDVATRTLEPTDQLLHVCLHGLGRGEAGGFRWIADAAVIVRAVDGEIDWERLLEQSSTHHLVEPMRHALRYLSERIGVSIPEVVLERLSRMPVSRRERLEYRVNTAAGWSGAICRHWLRYSRLDGDRGVVRKLIRFPRYLQGTLERKRLADVPLQMLSQRVRNALK